MSVNGFFPPSRFFLDVSPLSVFPVVYFMWHVFLRLLQHRTRDTGKVFLIHVRMLGDIYGRGSGEGGKRLAGQRIGDASSGRR